MANTASRLVGARWQAVWNPHRWSGMTVVLACVLIPAASPGDESKGPPLVLHGHQTAITMGVFTPDGNRAITASTDETARLWDLRDQREVRQFLGHSGPLYALALSGDGQTLATGAQDNTVRLWDVPQVQPLVSSLGHQGAVAGLAVTTDGRTLASVGVDRRLRLWDLAKQRTNLIGGGEVDVNDVSTSFLGHDAALSAVAIRGDGNLIATADQAGSIRLWSPFLPESQGRLDVGVPVVSLAFHSNNQQLFATGSDGLVRVWQLPVQPHRQFQGAPTPIAHLALAKNQPLALIVSSDDTIRTVQLNQGEIAKEFAPPLSGITTLAIAPNQTLAAIGAQNGDGVILDLNSGEILLRFGGHNGPVADIRFHSDNQQFFTTGVDATVRAWKLPAKTTLSAGHESAIIRLATSTSGQWHVTASQDETVRVWQSSGQAVRSLGKLASTPTAVAVRTDDGQIATADASGEVRLWNANNGSLDATLLAPEAVTAIAFDPKDSTWLTGDRNGWVRRWQVPMVGPVLANGHSQPVRVLAATPDGKWIVSGAMDRTLRVWNAENGQAIRTLEVPGGFGGAITTVSISDDGTRVAAGSDGGLIALWQLADGALVRSIQGTGGSIVDLKLFASGNKLASLHSDQSLRFWSVDGVQPTDAGADAIVPYQAFPLPDQDCRSIALAPDNRSIYVSGGSGEIRVWAIEDHQVTSDAPKHSFKPGAAAVNALAISSDGKRLAVACEDHHVYVYDPAEIVGNQSPVPRKRLAHPASVQRVAFSQDARQLVSSTGVANVFLWDLESEQLAQRIPGDTDAVHAVVFAGGHSKVVTAGADHSIRITATSVKSLYQIATDTSLGPVTHLVAGATETRFVALTGRSLTMIPVANDSVKVSRVKADEPPFVALRSSPDRSLWLIASADGQIAVLASDGKPLARLKTECKIVDAALSRDGKSVAVVDGQPAIKIFDLAQSRLAEVIHVAQPVNAVAWAADDQSLLATGAEGNVLVAQRALRAMWRSESPGKLVLATTPEGASIFVGGQDGTIFQHATSDGAVIKTWAGHPAPISQLAVSDNGKMVVSIGRDRTVAFWNVADGTLNHRIVHPTSIHSVSISPNSLRIATASEDGVVRLFDAATGLPLEQFADHGAGPATVQWLSDNLSLATAASDNLIRVYRSSSLRTLDPKHPELTQAVLAGGGAQVLLAANTGNLTAIDSATGQWVRQYNSEAPATTVAIRPDNQRVASGIANGSVLIWATTAPEPLQSLAVGEAVVSLAWSYDNQKLAVATDANRLLIFGPPRPPQPSQPGNELILHQETTVDSLVVAVAFATDNRSVFVADADGRISQWLYAAPGPWRQFNHGGPVYGLAVSRDGKTIVSCSADQTVRVWDAVTGGQRFQLSGHQGPVHAVALTPDESLAVSSGADRTIRLWDIVGGRQLKQLATLDETIYSIAVHPEAKTVAVAGADRNVYFLNIVSGATERTLIGHTDYIHSIGFNPAGTRLFSYGYAGQLRIWDIARDQPIWESQVGRIGNYGHYNFMGSHILFSSGDGIARVQEIPPEAR